MEAYKQEFIKFMVESDVLKFGSFTLKSGRQSPFFMNAGAYVTGYQLKKLGEYYAQAIHDNFGDDFDVLFGPAYKGIPLAVVTAIAYHELYGKEVKYCCDRKEAKDHGADKGNLLGASLSDGDRVVIVEDVTTSGKSIEETYPKLKEAADVDVVGLMVSLNRMEVGKGTDRAAGDDAGAGDGRLDEDAACTEMTLDGVGDGALIRDGDVEHVLLGVFDALLDSQGHFGGLAHAEADVALAIADDDEGDEGHARTTLDDLGHAVDVDDALLEVSLLLALAITRHSDSS